MYNSESSIGHRWTPGGNHISTYASLQNIPLHFRTAFGFLRDFVCWRARSLFETTLRGSSSEEEVSSTAPVLEYTRVNMIVRHMGKNKTGPWEGSPPLRLKANENLNAIC